VLVLVLVYVLVLVRMLVLVIVLSLSIVCVLARARALTLVLVQGAIRKWHPKAPVAVLTLYKGAVHGAAQGCTSLACGRSPHRRRVPRV
jgi:hypothetical protein